MLVSPLHFLQMESKFPPFLAFAVFNLDSLCHLLCRKLAIGCSEHLSIWETKSGNLHQKFTTCGNTSILSLCYSPSGTQLAAGLSSGEVQVFEILSSSPIFFLPPIAVSPLRIG